MAKSTRMTTLLVSFVVQLICCSLSSLLPSYRTLPQPLPDDVCGLDVIPVQSADCVHIIDDPRGTNLSRNAQCRSICEEKIPDFLDVTLQDANCSICSELEYEKYHSMWSDFDTTHVCLPRHKCIDACGPEKEGCIYTGTCISQLCFKGAHSGKSARFQRYTFAGPGTILAVDDEPGVEKGVELITNDTNPSQFPSVVRASGDGCKTKDGLHLFHVSYSCPLASYPVEDARQELIKDMGTQCRAVCENFNFSNYEVVIAPSVCGLCSKNDADQYFSLDANTLEKEVCIPREICIEQCGPEGYGCVYSGSCVSRICFSGINSKKPAVFTTLDDSGRKSEIELDNDGAAVDADPPIFAFVDKPEGNATAEAPAGQFPMIQTVPTSTPSAPPTSNFTTQNTPSPSSAVSASDKGVGAGQRSLWFWLAPVLGATLVLAVAVLTVMQLLRQRRHAREATQPPPGIKVRLNLSGKSLVTQGWKLAINKRRFFRVATWLWGLLHWCVYRCIATYLFGGKWQVVLCR